MVKIFFLEVEVSNNAANTAVVLHLKLLVKRIVVGNWRSIHHEKATKMSDTLVKRPQLLQSCELV